jgi:peptidase E
MTQHIVAMGGGGFAMEPDNPALDQYIVGLARGMSGADRPRVCFLAQAGGEKLDYIVRFYRAFVALGCTPSHLSLFEPHTADLAGYLGEQHMVYVGGGNTKSMLALWREWGVDAILRDVSQRGTVLAGVSAGAICWFESGMTDSIPGRMSALPCLGLLPGSCTPHYDGETMRRPSLHRMIASGELPPGCAFDDGAAGHFMDGALHAVVSSREAAKGYYVDLDSTSAQLQPAVRETPLHTRCLLA